MDIESSKTSKTSKLKKKHYETMLCCCAVTKQYVMCVAVREPAVYARKNGARADAGGPRAVF